MNTVIVSCRLIPDREISSIDLAKDKPKVALILTRYVMPSEPAGATNSSISLIMDARNDEMTVREPKNTDQMPPEIWGQIFANATLDDRGSPKSASPMPRGWAHCSRAMLLSSVCQYWRDIAINTKTLWATISIAPTRQSILSLSKFIELHLIRMDLLPCSLVIKFCTHVAYGDTFNELRPVLAQIRTLHQLRFYIHSSTRENIPNQLYSMLPAPKDLILEVHDVGWSPFVKINLADRPPKRLTLVACSTYTVSSSIPLTYFSGRLEEGYYFNNFENWTGYCIETLEHIVLRYSRFDTRPVRVTAPMLKYLEVTMFLLLNRTLLLYDMPNLCELVITNLYDWDKDKWEIVTKQLGEETSMNKLTIDSKEGINHPIMEGLDAIPSLTILELRGMAIESGLAHLKETLETWFFSLKSLRIVALVDYMGEGSVILDFARFIMNQRRNQLRIELNNCPNVSQDVRHYLFQIREPQ